MRSESERETQQIGSRLARYLRPGDIVCLSGSLGSGKTVLARGIARGLGNAAHEVSSPSFVLMHRYAGGKIPMCHFDFYRLPGPQSIPLLGYEESLYGDNVCVIEWPERLGHLLPDDFLEVCLSAGRQQNSRSIQFRAQGKHYEGLLKRFQRGDS